MQTNLERFNISGQATVVTGEGGLPKILITSPWSTAEIYLHGAHLTAFQKNDEAPLLFLSDSSHFASGKAIRGGVPICFPWFGPKEGQPAHGFARTATWELADTASLPDDRVGIRLVLPETQDGAGVFGGVAEFVVTVGETLTMELNVTNTTDEPLVFESCLHTYFTVGDIKDVSITGLKGTEYLDKVDNATRKLEFPDAIRIRSEVDRVYLDTKGPVEIHDGKLRRIITVEKSNSASTVVWNPWIAKAKALPDFGDQEYERMVCVESGNVGQNKITLGPRGLTQLQVILGSRSL